MCSDMNDSDTDSAEVQAVLDRVEDGVHAVLLVGEEERELIVPAEVLPNEARDGSWLRVTLAGDEVVRIVVDPEATAAVRARVRAKVARMRARNRPRRFRPRPRG